MENGRISARSVTYMLVADWIAKCCVLMPVLLAEQTPRGVWLSITAGLAIWCVVLSAVLRWVVPGQDFFETLNERCGGKAALIGASALFWYLIAHTAVFCRLWGGLFQAYLTPRVPIAVLCLVPAAAGVWFLSRGSETQAAVSRYMGVALLLLTVLPGVMAAGGIDAGAYHRSPGTDDFLRGGFEVFACLGGMSLPLLSGQLEEGCRPGRAVRIAGCVCAVTAGAFCAASAYLLTEGERWLSDFPAVEALRVLRPAGVWVGRLERAFALLLLVGLARTAAGGVEALWTVYRGLYQAVVSSGAVGRQRRRLRVPRIGQGTAAGAYGAELSAEITDMPEGVFPEPRGAELSERWADVREGAFPEIRGAELSGEAEGAIAERAPRFYGVEFAKELSDAPHMRNIHFYGGRMVQGLSARRIWWWIVLLGVYAMAVGFRDTSGALYFYRAYNLQIMTPVLAGLYVVLSALRFSSKKGL